jgi:cytochrome c biogenesis protein CcmG, thiol:disulfide interchange protein DsbE
MNGVRKAVNRPVTRRILSAGILLLGITWTLLSRPTAGATTAGRIPAPQVGFLAPGLTLTDLNGQSVSLSDHQGQVVLLNFWASWCPPCRAEMPAIQQVYQSYQDQGLVVLAVDATYQDAPASVRTFLGSFEHSFTILRDERAEANRLYAVNSLPTTFFIGRDGVIRDLVVGGPMTLAGLSARVQALLQEAP